MYNKILVPLDGSRLAEQILSYARLFAEAYGSVVELVQIEDPDARPPFWPPQPSSDYLKEVSSRYFPPPLRVDDKEERGKPAQVIVDRAKADPNCLIAMTTHGLSGTRRWLLGSVASKVIQTAFNPVLLIRSVKDRDPESEISLKCVVVPLDGSALAEIVLPQIIPLSRKMKLETNLVRVYDSPPETYPGVDAIYLDTLNRQTDAMRREAKTYLDGKTQELRAEGLERVISTVIQGDPAAEIIELARNTPDNLIAMTTHGRSGLGRWLLGSVAEKVVQHSRDPVLLVRPSEVKASEQ
jgi:nucleotide-binding universal stress UspA family protein